MHRDSGRATLGGQRREVGHAGGPMSVRKDYIAVSAAVAAVSANATDAEDGSTPPWRLG